MNLRFSNISSLQIAQLARFSTFILIGIVFTKTALTNSEIGEYETVLFVAGAISFFWLNGLTQGLLSIFKKSDNKNSQLFNAFISISILTLIAIAFLILLEKSFAEVLLKSSEIPFLKLLAVYLFFSVPANLGEYILLLKDKSKSIVSFSMVSYTIMLLLVALPAALNYSLEFCLYGLILASAIRYGWMLVLIIKNSILKIDFAFIAEYLKLSAPLILASFLSGSAQYIDGFIVSSHLDEASFAIFRYGAREFPLVLLLANAFSSSMVPEFANSHTLDASLEKIKSYSKKLSHFLFPVSILLLLITHTVFPIVFNESFQESAIIFNIYLLLIVSRLLFPQTILIGTKNTGIIATASLFEILLNVSLSLWFVNIWGMAGIAFATIIAYVAEKVFLIIQTKRILGISLNKYLNISLHLSYSLLLLLVFYLVEFVIYGNGIFN